MKGNLAPSRKGSLALSMNRRRIAMSSPKVEDALEVLSDALSSSPSESDRCIYIILCYLIREAREKRQDWSKSTAKEMLLAIDTLEKVVIEKSI